MSRLDAVPPTATISRGCASIAPAIASSAAAVIATTSAAVGGSPVTNRAVRRLEPRRRPAARAWPRGGTAQNSELPPPMSTTSVSRVTGRPSVTPMRVRNASSSWLRTCSGTLVVRSMSPTILAASAARRMGSVPRRVIIVAPSCRAVVTYPRSVATSSARAAAPRWARPSTAAPRPRNADSSTIGRSRWPAIAATSRCTELEPRSTDAPTRGRALIRRALGRWEGSPRSGAGPATVVRARWTKGPPGSRRRG